MKVYFKKKEIEIPVKRVSFFGRFFGLMFKSSGAENLLFEFEDDVNTRITSLFVFFPFLAVWLDAEDKVLDVKIVKPFTLSIFPKRPFRKLVEITFNSENREILGNLVEKRKI